MKRSTSPPDPPRLFDLPLGAESTAAALADEGAEPRPAGHDDAGPPMLFSDQMPSDPPAARGEPGATGDGEAGAPENPENPEPAAAPTPPPFASLALAGIFDLGLNLGVLIVALGGTWLLGVTPRLSLWPAIGVFLAVFSFLYFSLPLAFWGQTPGMAWTGLAARNEGDQPLTFGQTALRWLGATLTALALGLPLLLALGGRPLADRLSGSVTRARR